MRAYSHTCGKYPVRHPFAVGDVHRVQHLNKHRGEEAERDSQQHIAKEHRGFREGADISEVPVRNHRKTKYDDDTHFDHYHRAGDFE